MKTAINIAALLFLAAVPFARAEGPIVPPGPPGPTYKTYQEIYNKLCEVESKYQTLQNMYFANQQVITGLVGLNEIILESQIPGLLKWQISEIYPDNSVGQCSLAFTRDGKPAISFHQQDSPFNGSLKYAVLTGNPLPADVQTVDPLGVGEYNSLAFNPFNGQPAIAYYDGNNGDLKFAVNDGTNWQLEVIDNQGGIDGDTGLKASLAFKPGGNPVIAYERIHDGTTETLDVMVADFDGSVWQIALVASASTLLTSVSLAITPDGRSAIAYTDFDSLNYTEFDGAAWQSTVLGTAPGFGGCSLAFTPAGQPSLSYSKNRTGGGQNLAYSVFDGTTWQATTVDNVTTFISPETSLAIGPTGQPRIAYRGGDVPSTDLLYAEFDGASWYLTTIDDFGVMYQGFSLAFTPGHQPAIAYSGGHLVLGDFFRYAERKLISNFSPLIR